MIHSTVLFQYYLNFVFTSSLQQRKNTFIFIEKEYFFYLHSIKYSICNNSKYNIQGKIYFLSSLSRKEYRLFIKIPCLSKEKFSRFNLFNYKLHLNEPRRQLLIIL